MVKNNKSAPRIPQSQEPLIPVRERKTMRTLQMNDCRWPIGDPQRSDFHFCGKPKVADFPYCELHVRRAFQPARPRLHRDYYPGRAA